MANKPDVKEEKVLVEKYFGEKAQEFSSRQYLCGRLTVWKNSESLPARKACTFSMNEGKLIIPNEGDRQFRMVLSALLSEMSSADDICKLVNLISPSIRKAVIAILPYMKFELASWHSPELNNGEFEGFFENLTTGKIEKLSIATGGEVLLEDVGDGMTFILR